MRSFRLILVACALALIATLGPAHAAPGNTQQQPSSGLVLSVSQHPTTLDDGTPQQEVDVTYGAAAGVQIRLTEDRTALWFDGFADGVPALLVRDYPQTCGESHRFELTAIVNGVVTDRRAATVTLCPFATPSPTASPALSPTPAAAGQLPSSPPSPAATAAAAAAPAPPPPAAPEAAARTVPVGQPPVPAPPLEPPSEALSDGFVLAQTDDVAAASAIDAGLPLVRLLAIWLRGADNSGSGSGQYQYVQVANLGGAPQDMSNWALQGDSGNIIGLTYYFPDGFTLYPGDSCRIYVDHPADSTCTEGSFAFYQFWNDHGAATLWDNTNDLIDWLGY
ncbi:MAG: lamin tail domain-containing protein [Dehalococcoidia bacterium]